MKVSDYTLQLQSLEDWTPFLSAHSGLPGPRGNLELATAAARLDPLRLEPYLGFTPDCAPENTPETFLVFCGVMGLGVRLAGGENAALPRLKTFASDPRWRVREAVAAALQLWGDAQPAALFTEMWGWAGGSWFEQRAAVAAVCEPRLLKVPDQAEAALGLVDAITFHLSQARERRDPGFVALRKALGYAWSVALSALPQAGKARFSAWLDSPDRDVRWVLRENLKKNRLLRLDPVWVKDAAASLS